MFLKRVQKAKFREQTIPQTAIRKMVAHEMEQYVVKTFKKSLECWQNACDKKSLNLGKSKDIEIH